MPVSLNDVVSFAYTLTDDDGKLIDKGDKDSPLVYLHGHHNLIPGMEEAIQGKEAGDSFETIVSPEKGYGQRDASLDLVLGMDQFPPEHHEQLGPGVQFQGPHPEKEGESVVYTIHQIEDEKAYVSGNHPLAGMQLHFAIEILEVRAGSEEEIAHGHVHGAGGHAH